MTIYEMMIALAITAVIMLVLGNLVITTTRATIETDQKTRASVDLRSAIDKVETALLNATFFQVSRSTEVIFTADANTDPSYQPYGDFDGDGVQNVFDPDDDNDATQIRPSTSQWQIGYDLKDDDDDNDNQIDMRWRIRFSTAEKILYRDYSRDGQAWGANQTTLLTNVVSTPVFTFYGSENDLLLQNGATLDTNADGIISTQEIDSVANGGNGNFSVDGTTESNRIVTIGVYLDKDDEDADRNDDTHLSIEVMPPPLYLKRRP